MIVIAVDPARIILAKAPLRPGLDPKRANDLLLLFTGEGVYSALVGTAGWMHWAWADRTVAALAHHVFGIEVTSPPADACRNDSDDLPGRTREVTAPAGRPRADGTRSSR